MGALNHRGSKAGPRSGVLQPTSSPAWILVPGVIRALSPARVRCGRRRIGPSQVTLAFLFTDMDSCSASLFDVGQMTWTECLIWFLVWS